MEASVLALAFAFAFTCHFEHRKPVRENMPLLLLLPLLPLLPLLSAATFPLSAP